jgi:2',3'-cyclic-nucleotide 2'-phosphodiesterase/3'-nucleotidase
VKPVSCTETLAMYKVMNAAGFDGGGIGNHEFNYGLQYLSQVTGSRSTSTACPIRPRRDLRGPEVPAGAGQRLQRQDAPPLFQPYAILSKTLTATGPDGKTVTAPIKVGIIGFTPPAILSWDKRWLDGKVYTEGGGNGAEVHPRDARQGRRPGRRDLARRPG